MRAIDQEVFMVAATFSGDGDGPVEVRMVPFADCVRKDIGYFLNEQYQTFLKMKEVEYNGHYKADKDECLCIKGYSDPRDTIEGFASLCNGECRNVVKGVEELNDCHALLIHIPECPGKILIQKFSRSLVAMRGRFYGIVDRNRFADLSSSSFCFGSSLAGYYSIGDGKFCFRNMQTIRSAIPGFDEVYAPGADEEMIKHFFEGNSMFEPDSAKAIAHRGSKKVERLVWLINNAGVDVSSKLSALKRFNQLLNMKCFDDELLVFPNQVDRAVIILRIILGDVFELGGKVYFSNSRKAIPRFED